MAEDEGMPTERAMDSHHASSSPHHFEFDLDRGIRDQAVEKLNNSPLLPLATISSAKIRAFEIRLR